MKKSLSVVAMVTAGLLALAGCSGSSEIAAEEGTTTADTQQAASNSQGAVSNPQEPVVNPQPPRAAAVNPAADAVFTGSTGGAPTIAGSTAAADPDHA